MLLRPKYSNQPVKCPTSEECADRGHYVTPGSHLTQKGQTSEILSSTLLPSSNCTVRFYYNSQDEGTPSHSHLIRCPRKHMPIGFWLDD
ncbi:hypothetical protein DPEC_G00057120 [Dallia pectoralis]|uniref:Uncharacterized protein n=1 Tax=Dallia pectoralis TaxID=75939 RepID=A0ACC2H6D4_DALPE|nr:hypothetical protein DPEC_G00057120 [Dallia pectoralis]